MQKGFGLLEILISLFLISTTIFGALRLDILAQQTMYKARMLQNTQQWLQNAYEVLHSTLRIPTSCRSCGVLHQNQKTIAVLQDDLQQLIPNAKLEIRRASDTQIKIKICLEDNVCQEQIILV